MNFFNNLIQFNQDSNAYIIFIIHLISICKYEKDEKLAKLAPLMAKFEKVTLNGSQKMTAVGWEEVRYDPSHDVFSFTLIIIF